MLKTSKSLLAGAFAVAAIGGSFAVAAPAQAHTSGENCRVVSGRGQGCVSAAHHWAYVEDYSADNWGVRILLWNNLGQSFTVGDGNGSAAGVGGRHTVTASEVYTYFQVCAGVNGANTSCTARYVA
jgi:hypothetical protein